MLQQLLHKYLVLNGQLGIPDIGNFKLRRVPAYIDATGAYLQPPTTIIEFEQQTVAADKQFFQFLSQEIEVDEVAAIGQFNDWTKALKEKLAETASANVPLIGSLHKTPEGSLAFDPLPIETNFQPIAIPEGIVWKQETEEYDSLDKASDSGWWIYAVILFLLGAAAIAYHYL
jgi:hypothetical protein